MTFYNTTIIGGGAAGLICAIKASQSGKKTLIIEGNKSVGQKIRISGGGRCNFTNLDASAQNFLSQNSSFAISALKRFSSNDFIKMVQDHGIAFHEKTLGQLFCDGSSKEIIDMLIDGFKKNKVEILTETRVEDVAKIEKSETRINAKEKAIGSNENSESHFIVSTSQKEIKSRNVVIACGGLSIPKMGATDFGYQIARKFGLEVIKPKAALVPFTFDDELLARTKHMSGLSLMASVKIGKIKFREGVLFTHKGMSGPAILQISSYWKKGEKVKVDFAPDRDIFTWLKKEKEARAKQGIATLLTEILPKKLAAFLLQESEVEGKLADLSHAKLALVADAVNGWGFVPSGSEGFAKAEVTLGGVDVEEISSKSFVAKKVPGLYFIGEVLDVTGHLGGFNFQWAWSSGVAAGRHLSGK